ncbi:MAG: hypothetical protein AB7E52_01675 [Bdellovibrionales bacterium]
MTLTELAIVLGAMGLVMGTVWGIASTVWSSYRVYKTKQEIMDVVANVRDYYGPMGGIYSNTVSKTSWADGADITDILNDDSRRLIPIDMRLTRSSDTSAIRSSSGASFVVQSYSSGRTFRVILSGLSQSSCMRLLKEFPVLMPEMGVVRIGANSNNSTIDITNVVSPGASVSLPISAATAAAWCNASSSSNNEVNFDFKVKN